MEDRDAAHLAAPLEPRAVAAGEGPVLELGTQRLTLKVSATDTGGLFALVETVVNPQGGVPPHIHTIEDETWYVLEGRFDFVVGGVAVTATAGHTVFGPRNVAHAFRCTGETAGRLLTLATPGANFEDFARTMAERRYTPATIMADPNLRAEFMALNREHGIKMLPPG